MANTNRKIGVEVTDNGTIAKLTAQITKLNELLDRTAQPRKILPRAATAAISASGGSSTYGGSGEPFPSRSGLTRGTAGAFDRGETRDFARQAQGMGGLVQLYATFAANIYAVSAAFTALSKAADFTNMEKAADILSTKVGTSIRGLAQDIRSLTDGAISLTEAMSTASLGSSAGLTTKQIEELTKVAKGAAIALGRDMTDALSRVFKGTIKIEPELLDELGLMVKVDDANKAYAKTLMKTVSTLTDYERRQAFVNAVTTQGIAKYKELEGLDANPFSKLLASIQDLSTRTLTSINSVIGPFVNLLSESPTALLVGLTSLIALLLKGLIPAIGSLRAGWAAESVAHQQNLARYLTGIEERKQAVRELSKANTDAAKAEMLRQRKLVEDALPKEIAKTAEGRQLTSSLREITKAGDIAAINAAKAGAEAALVKVADKLTQRIQATAEKLQRTSQAGFGATGAYADLAALNKALEKSARDRLALESRLATVQQGIVTTSAVNLGHVRQMSELEKSSLEVQNAQKVADAYQKATLARERLTNAYDAASNLGMLQGFRELNTNIQAATSSTTLWGRSMQYAQGTFGILSIGVSKLVGMFSVWMMLFTVLIPFVGTLAEKIGLIGENTKNLAESIRKASESTKTFSDVQKRLAEGVDLSTQYDLQASKATSYAESVERVAKAHRELRDLKDSNEYGGMWLEGSKMLLGLGQYDKKEELRVVELYEEARKRGDIKDEDAVMLPRVVASAFYKAIPERELTKESYLDARSTDKTMSTMEAAGAISRIKELSKEQLEYAENSKAVTQNLKELKDLSTEYATTLVNQSKELKALNALASSSVALQKNIGTLSTTNAVDIFKFLEGITTEFESFSDTGLGDTLSMLRMELLNADQAAFDFADTLQKGINSEGKSFNETNAEFKARVDASRERELQVGRSRALEGSGGKDFVATKISEFTLKAVKSLADFSLATSRAAVAQGRVTQRLNSFGIFSQVGQGRSAGILASARYSAEDEQARIKLGLLRTEESQLAKQLNLQKGTLATQVGEASKAYLTAKGIPGGTIQGRTSEEKAKTLLKLTDSSLNAFRPGIDALRLSIIDLTAKLEKLKLDKELIETERTEPAARSFDTRIKTIESTRIDEIAAIRVGSLEEQNTISEKYAGQLSLGAFGAEDSKAYETSLNNIAATIKEQEALQREASAKSKALYAEYLVQLPRDKQKAALLLSDKTELDAQILQSSEDTKASRLIKGALETQEAKRLNYTIPLGQLESMSQLLEAQIDYAAENAAYLLSTERSYASILSLTESQLASTMEGFSVQKKSLEMQKKVQREIISDPKTSPIAKIDAAQGLIKLEQDHLVYQLKAQKEVSSLLKERNELNLKTIEQLQGPMGIISEDSLQGGITVAMDRIEETLGKSKSTMSQFATGIVDAVDTMIDSFSTMIQKMNETAVTWVAFRDMVRNTLSDMFRDMASDTFKNSAKELLKTGAKKLGFDTRTSSQLAAEKLGITAESSLTQLQQINAGIQALLSNNGGYASIGTFDSMTSNATESLTGFPGEIAYTYDDKKLEGIKLKQTTTLGEAAESSASAASLTTKAADTFFSGANILKMAAGGIVGALVTGNVKGAVAGILSTVASAYLTKGISSVTGLAKGGIFGAAGNIPLTAYARGGVATSPQLALFGEGSKNEAFVPLPDNRSIPVTLKGGGSGATFGDTNISVVVNTSNGTANTSVSTEQATNLSKALSTSIKAAIQEEIMKQMKPRGLLYG